MMYLGDYVEDETVYFIWSSNSGAGASITRATNGTVSVYKDNGTTQSTAGITDTEDFDGLTGIHACTIDTSADAFYAAGADYAVVLSAATIDGQVVNAVLAHFSIQNRAGLRPTTAGRTLDVSAGGEAGMDWANIGSPTTAQNLSATNIDVDQVVASVSGAVGSVTGTVGGNVTGSVGSVASGGITAASIAADAITAAKIADGAIDAATFAAGAINAAAIATDAITAAKIAADAIGASELAADAVTEIQTGLATPTNITAGTITTVTNLTNAPTSGDLTATMKASVNAEVVDGLNVDTYAEPGQATPAATASLATKLNYLYKAWRNRLTQTATAYNLYNDDATTVAQKATISDDGTTYDKGEIATGP